MISSEFSPAVLMEKVEASRAAINDFDFAQALEISHDISDYMDVHSLEGVIETDGKSRDYSIVVVGYRPVEEHLSLVRFLKTLNPDRFEVIFAENAADPVFDISESDAGGNIRVLRLGDNLGVGIARNMAIKSATGRGILMIDDDGLTNESSLEALIELFEAAQATVVRGKVQPKTPSDQSPPHYDPGDQIVQRYCDIEGMSIWRKSEIERVRMFDPILFGHEGVELTARLYPYNGPDAFLYQPKAVLWHDFSQDPNKVEEKMARYERLNGYLAYKLPDYGRILNVFRKAPADVTACALLQHRMDFTRASAAGADDKDDTVAFITTCYNGAEFIAEFVGGLVAQTDQNFKLVFVDDGSGDGSADLLEDILPASIARTIIRSDNQGRSAALNQAVEAADCDICLVADVDDIPVPQRVAWTRAGFAQYPDASMLGFMIFDVNSHARASRPFPRQAVPLSVRGYFGMPAPFPGFAFRKSMVPTRFDTSLRAGVDCDWIFRSMINSGCDGYLIPLNVTFYRTHGGQITSSGRPLQRQTSLRYLQARHNALLGGEPIEQDVLERFAGWTPINSGEDYWRVHDYALRLIKATGISENLHAEALRREIYGHIDNLHLALLRTDRQKLKNKIAALESETTYQRSALDEVYRSTSWKLTAPMRVVRSFLSK